MKTRIKRETLYCICATILAAAAVALSMHVFVYPADFAPSGVDGVATMLQHLTGLNAGLFTFAINLPLLIAAYFILNRRYVAYTLLYTICFSLFLVLLEQIDFYRFTTQTDRLLPAIFGGVGQGLTGIMLRIGASSGGIDVMAGMVRRKMPHQNIESIISVIGFLILLISYPVYRDLESVLLSAVEIVICERVTATILRNSRNAVRFEIITEQADILKQEILSELQRGATVLPAHGLYSQQPRQLILCVVHYRQIPTFLRILSKYPDAFVCYSDVMGVRGPFDRPEHERMV